MTPDAAPVSQQFALRGAAASASATATGRAPEIVALFPLGFTDRALKARHAQGRVKAHREGFDLFEFPSNARLLTFDLFRFVDALASKYAGRGIEGVISANEQFGALTAALLAQRLKLPGTDPRAVLTCQHKAYCRTRLQDIAPEANVAHWAFPYTWRESEPQGLALPFYVKPVKATFSVLARRIDTRDALRRHLDFTPYERFIIKRLVRPFNDAFRQLIGRPQHYEVDAHWMIAEAPLTGVQLNLDGYVYQGEVRVLGCVDEIMYPGTDAFARFQYPSRLPAEVLDRARDLTRRIMNGLGFDHGFFNIEFFFDPATDALKLIEINPRLASQLADFYERVDGLRVFDMLIELAQGRDPARLARVRPSAGVTASFVWRTFAGAAPPRKVDSAARDWLARQYPDALLHEYHKQGHGLQREYKWLGSHRYATLNIGAENETQLHERYASVCARFGWPAAF